MTVQMMVIIMVIKRILILMMIFHHKVDLVENVRNFFRELDVPYQAYMKFF